MAAAAKTVRVIDGTDVVIVQAYERMWHLPAKGDAQLGRRTLCGLEGFVYSSSVTAQRKACQVCVGRAPKGVIVKTRARPKSAKRRGSPCKISETQLRALHHAHWEQRVPINELGRRYWQRFGYKSARACGNTISHHFRCRGWETHDRIEMTVQASTRHGMKRRNGKSSVYKRFQADQVGAQYDAPCAALTRLGKPCRARAMQGSDVCQSHDGGRRAAHVAHMAAMRARSPIHDPARLEDAAPLSALLVAYQAAGGRWRALARETAVPEHWLSHIAKGKQERVDRSRAQTIREALAS
jgi:hypothetical protein